MARVSIPRGELNAVDLPRICVVTGATEGVFFEPVVFRKTSVIWWVALGGTCMVTGGVGLVLGPVLLGLAHVFATKVRAEIPYTIEGLRLARRAEVLRIAAFASVALSAVAMPLTAVDWARSSTWL